MNTTASPFRSLTEKYETYAAIETELGNDAWADGDYHRAVRLWRLAAYWSQCAANTPQECAR